MRPRSNCTQQPQQQPAGGIPSVQVNPACRFMMRLSRCTRKTCSRTYTIHDPHKRPSLPVDAASPWHQLAQGLQSRVATAPHRDMQVSAHAYRGHGGGSPTLDDQGASPLVVRACSGTSSLAATISANGSAHTPAAGSPSGEATACCHSSSAAVGTGIRGRPAKSCEPR